MIQEINKSAEHGYEKYTGPINMEMLRGGLYPDVLGLHVDDGDKRIIINENQD